MKRSFPVIDADGHVLERDRELREFMPPQFRAVEGKREYPLFSWDGWARGALSPHKREHPSPDLWLPACYVHPLLRKNLPTPAAAAPVRRPQQ